MMKRVIAVVLAAAVCMFTVSVNAQIPTVKQSVGSAGHNTAWLRSHNYQSCKQPDGSAGGWCCPGGQRNIDPKDGFCRAGSAHEVVHASPAPEADSDTITVSRSEFNRVRQPEVTPPATTPAPPVAAGPSRVFTANVSIEEWAADMKSDGRKGIINAKAEDIIAEIKKLSSVDVTAESLFNGYLVDCQDAGVKGKQRFGLKVEGGSKKFAPVDGTFEKCQSGQKLYVVKDGDKHVAIAETTVNGSFLLGTGTPAVKIDR
jgi:hypothetical protein